MTSTVGRARHAGPLFAPMPVLQRLRNVFPLTPSDAPGPRSCAQPSARGHSRGRSDRAAWPQPAAAPVPCGRAGSASRRRRPAGRRWCADRRHRSASAGVASRRRTRARTDERAFTRRGVGDRADGHGRHLDDEVDAIAQRPGQPRRDSARSAPACSGRRAVRRRGSRTGTGSSRPPARSGGKDGRPRRARDRDAPFLERLPQHFEHAAIELRHLVEKQHAVVRERDLARPRNGAAADERDVGHGVMRRAERPPASAGRRRAAACPPPNGSPCTRALRRRSAAAGSPPSRRASIVLPAPGGPMRSRLCPPAAATSSARRASSCPRTSARSPSRRWRGICGTAALARRRARIRRAFNASSASGQRSHRRRRSGHRRRTPRRAFCGGSSRRVQPEAPGGDGNRQHAADGVDAAVERQLAEHERVVNGLRRRAVPSSPGRRVQSADRMTSPPCARRPAPG